MMGQADVDAAVAALEQRLPDSLAPLARVAYNFRWTWLPEGPETFRALEPERWILSRRNPIRFLQELPQVALDAAAGDPDVVRRVQPLADRLDADLGREPADLGIDPDRPVAFLCAEFGIHESLPIYSGGLGVLAGDILKESSDMALPMVGMGLLYRRGYFNQRVDTSGWQHEYWTETDVHLTAAAQVTDDGEPVTITVPIWGREVSARIWRVDVGRVPLYLLDTDLAVNSLVDRWISARLYDGNPEIRLAQYALLGLGGMRALRALGIDPTVLHLNEGHAAMAALELASERAAQGEAFADAVEAARRRVVFTTHTPVAAGNETYRADELMPVFAELPARLGADWDSLLALGRIDPQDRNEATGMTPLAMRLSRSTNAVSRRHGGVARDMWRPMYPDRQADEVPITHVTNGVHLPTWMGPHMRGLLDRHLGEDWHQRACEPETWKPVDDIPDEELWAARTKAREKLVRFMRARSATERLTRGEPLDYVGAAARAFDGDTLTLGFARRLATYKRLHLLTLDASRALALLDEPHPVQLLIAGKAHPKDDDGKRAVQTLFGLKSAPRVAERVAFLEDYDLATGRALVAGCDVWLNVPRPPLEASGTSGMKAAMNGALNVSVLDGWWAEGHDGTNGWAIDGDYDADFGAQDHRHADALYGLLENEVVPLFYDRDDRGIPTGWLERVRAALRSVGSQFCARRMVREYTERIYP